MSFATVEWIDVFTRKVYKDIVVDSLKYCQKAKGLELYSWVLMSNHMHVIVRAKEGHKLSGIIRDFKKFTAQQTIKVVQDEPESRKGWLLAEMLKAGQSNSKKQTYQLWRNDNHPIELFSNAVIDQKMEYIHNNPVEAGIVSSPSDYVYSSARNYAGEQGLIDVELL